MIDLDRPLVATAGYVVIAALFGGRPGPVLCPYRRWRGRPCPACGLTRSIARLARADLRGSWAANPAGPAVVVAVVVLAARRRRG